MRKISLEGLAKKELNLAAITGRSVEARERRLVPEVVEQFFVESAPYVDVAPKPLGKNSHIYRVGKLPRPILALGNSLEARFGQLAHDYDRLTFDKILLQQDPTLEWVTPGHPLFEAVREGLSERGADHLRRGAMFYQLDRELPARLDVFGASVKDGRGNILHRRLFVVETRPDSTMTIRQPTLLSELVPAPGGIPAPDDGALPDRLRVEAYLLTGALEPFLQEVTADHDRQVATVRAHVEIALGAIIERQVVQHADCWAGKLMG